MSETEPARPAAGFIEPRVQEEFPGLRLDWILAHSPRRTSPPPLVRRLQELAGRYRGASVVAMRTKPIPQAFRVFFRQIGLDPDIDRVPSERAAVARLMYGGFRSAGLIADATLVALIETGVPVWALDADVVDEGGPGIRIATEADGERDPSVSPGSLAVADRSIIHAPLFGDPLPGHAAGPGTHRLLLFSVAVDGVPAIHIEECLWTCLEWLR